jgi:hypothetical protein
MKRLIFATCVLIFSDTAVCARAQHLRCKQLTSTLIPFIYKNAKGSDLRNMLTILLKIKNLRCNIRSWVKVADPLNEYLMK